MQHLHRFGILVASLALAHAAHAAGTVELPNTPDTGNTSAPSNWRFAPGQVFNGVAGALDGVARLSFTAKSDGLSYACSGSLLAGGAYVLTAAHCADDFTSMKVDFGWYGGVAQLGSRTVATTDVWVNPNWTGDLDTGADIAIIKLSAPMTNIAGYKISTTNDVGKKHLVAGYGSTQQADVNADTNWNDRNYGHYGYNTFDVLSVDFNTTIYASDPVYGQASYYRFGATYMVDFDRPGNANYNVLQRAATKYGGNWTSDAGWGADEALIAGGDSGGGDFVWNGTEWILSGVHSWGWNNPCASVSSGGLGLSGCTGLNSNPSSYGDLSGSTATFSHVEWINSIVNPAAVPEPESYALMLVGLGLVAGVVRRRRA
ncbi:trypsin-like serine protease [Roseateles sp.]|uniref:trypsin-like serine protease n=1 Tax=Roseateles sp. TaxID=1971397 RepID=UPI0039EB65E4